MLDRLAARAPAPHLSGVHALSDAHAAFAARIRLAGLAERTIDAQYYIWHDDISGRLLLGALAEAADRGVRVRILVDDNGTSGLDSTFAGLDRHPLIDVRLFNPFVIRQPKPVGYLMDFFRLNRRMHNKSFTVDGTATIIGGRNIGDEYFGARAGDLFADLDVLAVGPVAGEVAADFERYWESASAYPAPAILKGTIPETRVAFAARVGEVMREERGRVYLGTIRDLRFPGDGDGDLPLEWVAVKMVSDDPAKALGRLHERQTLSGRLAAVLERPARQIGLVSGYFVPTAAGVAAFCAMARNGIDVRILTNSVRATDVAVVHAGYVRRRRPLLRCGVRLYELCGEEPLGGRQRGRRSLFGSGAPRKTLTQASRGRPALRSSGSVLHAKTFTIDRERIFVGSFNFDPRSMHLNTELGFIIESPRLAGQLQDLLEDEPNLGAYVLELDSGGRMVWAEHRDDGTTVRHRTEPGTTLPGRVMMRLLSRLPIEWML
jgi:putative cardiolipin synthase